jgi:hypothetical protein
MTPIDNLTSSFECLWEAKLYLLRTIEAVDQSAQPELKAILADVAAARNRVEAMLIALPETPPAAPAQPPG